MKFFDLSSYYDNLNLDKLKKIFPDLEDRIKKLSLMQNHTYQNKKIAALALIHRSALVYWPHNKNDVFSNEKFEYLGDSLLNFFITGYSMSLLPTLTEGELSKLRSVIVGSENLAKKSETLKLGSYLMFGKTEKSVVYSKQHNILADAFEAATAALLLDAGYVKTSEWLSEIFRSDILSVSKNLQDLDAKGALQHWAQSEFGSVPVYHAIDIAKNQNQPMFEVSVVINGKKFARACAKTKKEASKKVAEAALLIAKNGGQ